jgi:hypothetical protein
VTPLMKNATGNPMGEKLRVAPGETGVFYVHNGQDLVIHEVQPEELALDLATERFADAE